MAHVVLSSTERKVGYEVLRMRQPRPAGHCGRRGPVRGDDRESRVVERMCRAQRWAGATRTRGPHASNRRACKLIKRNASPRNQANTAFGDFSTNT